MRFRISACARADHRPIVATSMVSTSPLFHGRCVPRLGIVLYTTEDKAGNSLQFEMHPSLPIGEDENTPMHYAVRE